MIDYAALEPIPEEARPRHLYVMTLDGVPVDALEELGYAPVSVLSMPRTTEAELETYHRCYLQGIAEHTIDPTKAQASGLELELKAHDRLDKKKFVASSGKRETSDALEEALSWRESRHSFAATTAIDAREAVRVIETIRAMTHEQLRGIIKAGGK